MKKLLSILFACLVAMQCAFAAVNINTASQEELDKLPGIGPVKAQAIIEDRTKNGLFKSVDDLKRVKGIGDATLEKLRSDISVSGATAAPKSPAKPAAAPAMPANKEAKADESKAGKTDKADKVEMKGDKVDKAAGADMSKADKAEKKAAKKAEKKAKEEEKKAARK